MESDHRQGRVLRDDTIMPAFYITGWSKRGANGTIGTNRGDSIATIESPSADKSELAAKPKQHPKTSLDVTYAEQACQHWCIAGH